MAQELGKIERPTAESFEGSRKLFFVPLVYSPTEPPPDYVGTLERYWAGARNQVRRLAERTSPVRHVFHEAIFQEGEEAARTIEQLNRRSHSLIAEFVEGGARIEALEDAETFYEAIDWQRVLMLGPSSRKVIDAALSGYRDATKRRYELMAQRIDQALKPGESAILLMPEEHAIQFPRDVQVFYVAPPSLDEIHRWLREREERERREVRASKEASAAPAQEASSPDVAAGATDQNA
jgi:hypothetical protein